MKITTPVINFGTYEAVVYKADSTPDGYFSLQSFSNFNDLKLYDSANKYPYAIFEPDLWLLDGSFKIKPAAGTIHAGLMNTSESNSAGVFPYPPVLVATFGSAHDTDGLRLRFDDNSGDWASSITVAYYDAAGALIRSDNYYPTSAIFSVTQAVTAFKKVVIVFNSTNNPYRFFRLLDIDYCLTYYLQGDEIKQISVVEEICPTATELPFCTLDFRLVTSDPQFSIIEPAGGYSLLQQRHPIYVYERIDTSLDFIGKYFVDTWENVSDKEVSIHAIDTIGVLGLRDYVGNWVGENANNFLINKLLTPIGVEFTIDSSVASTMMAGVLPIGTYREALQQMCLAIGAYATCARSRTVDIHSMELASTIVTPDYTVTAAEKSLSQNIKLKALVTGVEITSHDSDFSGISKVVYGPIPWPVASVFTIYFTEPINPANVTVTGATVTASDVNFMTLTVTSSPVTVTVEGLIDSTTLKGVYASSLPVGVLPNVVKITDGILLRQSIQIATAQRLYDYYQQRYLMKIRLYASSVKVGDSILVDTTNSRQIIGVVEKASVNLSGGFVSDIDIVGIVKPL